MKKIIANAPLCALLCIATTVKKSRPTAEIFAYLLGYIQYSQKKIKYTLHKTYTDKGAITGIWSVLSTAEVTKSDNNLANDRNEVACYMGA